MPLSRTIGSSTISKIFLWIAVIFVGALSTTTASFASDSADKMKSRVKQIHEVVDADSAHAQEIYKDIHEHPELGFTETRTAGIVARELRALGFEVKTGIGKTGVAGILTKRMGSQNAWGQVLHRAWLS